MTPNLTCQPQSYCESVLDAARAPRSGGTCTVATGLVAFSIALAPGTFPPPGRPTTRIQAVLRRCQKRIRAIGADREYFAEADIFGGQTLRWPATSLFAGRGMANPLKLAAKKFTLNTGSIYARPIKTNHRLG